MIKHDINCKYLFHIKNNPAPNPSKSLFVLTDWQTNIMELMCTRKGENALIPRKVFQRARITLTNRDRLSEWKHSAHFRMIWLYRTLYAFVLSDMDRHENPFLGNMEIYLCFKMYIFVNVYGDGFGSHTTWDKTTVLFGGHDLIWFYFVWRRHENMPPCTGSGVNNNHGRIA